MSGEVPRAGVTALPNLVTLFRLFLIFPFSALIVSGRLASAAIVFLIATASDGIDGRLARRLDQRTVLGAVLDPLVDKLLMLVGSMALTVSGLLPVWLMVLIVGRDVTIICGIVLLIVLKRPLRIAPLWISKVNTVVQSCTIITLLATRIAGVDWIASWLSVWMIVITALTTVGSGLAYVVLGYRLMGQRISTDTAIPSISTILMKEVRQQKGNPLV